MIYSAEPSLSTVVVFGIWCGDHRQQDVAVTAMYEQQIGNNGLDLAPLFVLV